MQASTYSYDLNGNLYTYPYKKITSAKYYYHNNPKDLTINSNFLKFTYDASGTKLRKQVLNSSSQQILKQDYVSGVEYRNDTIEAIYHSDGRAVWNGSAWRYEYNVSDHLGNVRAVISDLDNDKILDFTGVATTNEIINVNSYYSFGMVMQNGNFANNTTTPDTKYQYNNKEFNGDWGLNLLDYGARWYDPAIGRFTGVDALADHLNQVDKSPYAYAWNNPVKLNDPDGNCPFCVIPLIIAAVEAALEALVVTTVVVASAKTVENVIEQTKTNEDTKKNLPTPHVFMNQTNNQEDKNLFNPFKLEVKSSDNKTVKRSTSEHDKDARPSTKQDHQTGQSRKATEQAAADKKYAATKSTKVHQTNNQKKRDNSDYLRKGPK